MRSTIANDSNGPDGLTPVDPLVYEPPGLLPRLQPVPCAAINLLLRSPPSPAPLNVVFYRIKKLRCLDKEIRSLVFNGLRNSVSLLSLSKEIKMKRPIKLINKEI